MSKTKIAVLIVIAVSVIVFLYFFLESQPKGKPQFEVAYFKGEYDPIWGTYDIHFQLKNIGNGTASLIYGKIRFDNSSAVSWGVDPADTVLQPGQTSPLIWAESSNKPVATHATIIIECAEREPQQIIQPISIPP